MIGDGIKQYDHFKDGKTFELAGCAADYRNKNHKTRFMVKYFGGTLSVRLLTVYFIKRRYMSSRCTQTLIIRGIGKTVSLCPMLSSLTRAILDSLHLQEAYPMYTISLLFLRTV